MKELLEKFKGEAKFLNSIRIIFYILGIILIFVGGIELMIMVYISLFAFLIGRFYEKTIAVVKDYRLAQKVNKMSYKQAEYDIMKKELDNLRKAIQHQRPINSRPTPPPTYYPNEFESEVF